MEHTSLNQIYLSFQDSNLTQNFERSSSVFKVGSLDIDTDWTDKLRASIDEELEERDKDGNSEVHLFKISRCLIAEHKILKGQTSLFPSSSHSSSSSFMMAPSLSVQSVCMSRCSAAAHIFKSNLSIFSGLLISPKILKDLHLSSKLDL